MCSLIEMKNDPQVTKMTQKFEFIATRTIEKPPMKSSTYYASIESGGNEEPDVPGMTSRVDERPSTLPDVDNVESSSASLNRETEMSADVEMNKDDHVTESDDAAVAQAMDEDSVTQPAKEKLSKKFRRWQETESLLYSDLELSQNYPESSVIVSDSSSSQNNVDQSEILTQPSGEPGILLFDIGGGQLLEMIDTGEKDDKLVPASGRHVRETSSDLTDDILERNLEVTDRNDTFDGRVETDLKISGMKYEEQDIDLSQIVEYNRPSRVEEKPHDYHLFDHEPLHVDRVESRTSVNSRGGIYQEKSTESTDSEHTLDPEGSPVVKTREMSEPEERTIRPHQLLYEDQLQMMARDADELQQEVDTTVNSRDLETTDEIVVATKVTEVKTVLMQLGESGNISVMETTEVKTDTDMKETKKILERDEVVVSHSSDHKASDVAPFVPLSPSPSPAGSLRSRTPDRHSPSALLAASDSVEKLETAVTDSRDTVAETWLGVGVDAGLYVAICPYEPETDDVMSLHEGEFLEMLEDAAEDWWLVKKSFDGREGYVPAQYLRDKQSDDRILEAEVAKQMNSISIDSSKALLFCI